VATGEDQTQSVIWIFHDFLNRRRFGERLETRLFVFEFCLFFSARLVAADCIEQPSLRDGG
jgi:hypothetical protein